MFLFLPLLTGVFSTDFLVNMIARSVHCGLRYTKKLTGSDFISNIKKVYLRN